jgi:hypothetical protein
MLTREMQVIPIPLHAPDMTLLHTEQFAVDSYSGVHVLNFSTDTNDPEYLILGVCILLRV